VPTPVLGQQCQVDRRGHRPVLAEHRVRELEQRVTAPGQTREQVFPKVGCEVERIPPGIVVQHTHLCGLGPPCLRVSSRAFAGLPEV